MTLPAERSHRPVVGRSPRRGKYHNVATTARIVVSDRDPAFRQVLCQRLEAEGYEVRAYEDSIAILANGDVVADALIVTVAPGSTSVVELRDRFGGALLAMMPRDTATADALDVIDAGADDFVIKPFSSRELMTRLRAVLRRTNAPTCAGTQFTFDGLTIDAGRREVFVGDVEVLMPAKEFDLLEFLASSPKQVFTREQLMLHVWGTDAAVNTATVTEHIRRLRLRIEPDPHRPRWIQTVWSVGYRFTP